MSSTTETRLAYAKYGKTNVRVFRVVRGEDGVHTVVEYSVETLLEGDIETSYTQADNSVVVATDSVKNITYFLAKTSPHILSPEKFALHIGAFFVSKYSHIHRVHVEMTQLRWSRIAVGPNAEAHKHAFVRDGEERRGVRVVVSQTDTPTKLTATLTSTLSNLLVLKSTGSAFENFYKDEFTTLKAVDDRIFSTSVDCEWTFGESLEVRAVEEEGGLWGLQVGEGEGGVWDENVGERVRRATLEVFAVDESASVQATLYKMAERVIAENKGVREVSYRLPNKHHVPVDMGYLGIDNLTPAKAEVFCPIDAPR